MKRLGIAALLCSVALAPVPASAIDVWDLSGADGNSGTDNELANGSSQVHDLQASAGVADQDWYLVGQLPYSSYEVIVDGLTEEVAIIPASEANDALRLDLVDSGGGLISSGYAFSSIGAARTLRFRNTSSTEITTQYVRVQGAVDGCGTACTTNAEYRIQLRETTLMAPRFNNGGGQLTVVLLQNSAPTVTGSPTSVSGTVRFWSPAGALLGQQNVSLPANGGAVVNTSTIPGAAGASGFITFDHLGRYGQVTGKAVALEPSTGFTFDTAFIPKLY
ncbi:MAG: hypothetical protein ABW221_25820 [Vicinamibacteria bacterium]